MILSSTCFSATPFSTATISFETCVVQPHVLFVGLDSKTILVSTIVGRRLSRPEVCLIG